MLEETLQKIDGTINGINTHSDFSNTLKNKINCSLQEEAFSHSLRLEGIGSLSDSPIDLPKKRREEYHNALDNLKEAKKYLDNYGINFSTMAVLGYIIEPETHPFANFRNKDVLFGRFAPPRHQVVPNKVKDLEQELFLTPQHPVVSAVNFHVDFVNIHPYLDGNGRTARLLQDKHLENNGYPIPKIPEGEKDLYIELLGKRLELQNSGNLFPWSTEFPNDEFTLYVASKVLDSTLEMRELLELKRHYQVDLSKVTSPEIYYSLDHQFKNLAKSQKRGNIKTKKSIPSKNTLSISIMGDISSEEVKKILNKQKGKGFKSYDISVEE